MNIYKITVEEIIHTKYEIEADSQQEAEDALGMGDELPTDISTRDWDIIEIEEYK